MWVQISKIYFGVCSILCYNKYGDAMKKFLTWLVTVGILCTILFYREQIFSYLLVEIIYPHEFVVYEPNQYYQEIDYKFVQETDDFTPKNRQELFNVFYTVLNRGWDSFSFVCDLSYTDCVTDIQNILDEGTELSSLNNFVHPYNNYKEIEIMVNNFGRVDVFIDKLYSDREIQEIDAAIDKIYNEIILESMTLEEKIKTVHDYIINTTKYLREKEVDENGDLLFPLGTNKAYGPILNHVASCGGYTDAMALFLYRMGVQNYKISSVEHIWNLVYIDDSWKHLDLTWDDPITTTDEDVLTYNFFLISTKELILKDVAEHDYNASIFMETEESN